jgi:hypothetical protein
MPATCHLIAGMARSYMLRRCGKGTKSKQHTQGLCQ